MWLCSVVGFGYLLIRFGSRCCMCLRFLVWLVVCIVGLVLFGLKVVLISSVLLLSGIV